VTLAAPSPEDPAARMIEVKDCEVYKNFFKVRHGK
jgi:hypothetical protein